MATAGSTPAGFPLLVESLPRGAHPLPKVTMARSHSGTAGPPSGLPLLAVSPPQGTAIVHVTADHGAPGIGSLPRPEPFIPVDF